LYTDWTGPIAVLKHTYVCVASFQQHSNLSASIYRQWS